MASLHAGVRKRVKTKGLAGFCKGWRPDGGDAEARQALHFLRRVAVGASRHQSQQAQPLELTPDPEALAGIQ